MSNRFPPVPDQHPVAGYEAIAVAATGGIAARAAEMPRDAAGAQAPEEIRTAHRAVEIVLQTADQLSSRNQRSVNLRFLVGDADLNVRVELRANELRTTFRTDSSELRAALAHEWQFVTAASSAGDRGFRFAPPAFGQNEQPGHTALAGDASSQQRQGQAHRDPSESPVHSAPRFNSGASPRAATGGTEVRSNAGGKSLHLHTLA